MATIQHVAKARKEQGYCYTCHKPIEAGASYDWFKANRFSPRLAWHAECKQPRPSAMESNDKRSTAMAAFEDGYDAVDELKVEDYLDVEGADEDSDDEEGDRYATAATSLLNDLQEIAGQVAEGVREAAEAWRESASNIESGFGTSTYQSDEMNDHGDTYDGVADSAEQAHDQVDPWDPEQYGEGDEGWIEWANGALDTFREDLGSAEMDLD